MLVGLAHVLEHGPAIDSLLQATGAPATARWGPLATWLRHNPTLTPWVVLVRRDGELVAAALLVRASRGGIHRFETMGEKHLPGRLPARDAASTDALVDAVVSALKAVRGPWVLHLNYLEADDPAAAAIAAAFPSASTEDEVSPRLTFRPGDPFHAHLTRNTRSALSKARNRIAKASIVADTRWTTDIDTIVDTVPEIMALYQKRTIQLQQNTSLLDDPGYRRYFADMVRAFAEAGLIRLLTVRLDGQLASYVMCLESDGVLLVYSNRMSPEWAPYSPGALANAEAVRLAHADPTIHSIDWGTGLQRYKLSGDIALHPHRHTHVWSSAPVRRAWLCVQRFRAALGQ